MPVVNLDLARAARKLGVIASIEGEPGDLWLVLRSRADNSVIAQARLPARQDGDQRQGEADRAEMRATRSGQ
jgi:hypothetical protein